MDSKQAALMNSALNSIAKSLMSINRNLVSLVEQTQVGQDYPPVGSEERKQLIEASYRGRCGMNADLYRIKHPERCPEVDSDGPPEDLHWPHREDPICPDCDGTGQVLPAAVDMSDHCPCPTCEGSGEMSPTQQARSDNPLTQEVIDAAIKALKNLKWRFHPKREAKQTRHLRILIKQLEELKEMDPATKIPCPDTGTWDPLGQGGGG